MDQNTRLGRSVQWRGTLIAIILSLVVVGQSRIVQTKFGTIRGFWSKSAKGKLAAHYLGVPYAEPPIGDLRFRSPQPWTRKWNVTYDARVDANKCIQSGSSGEIVGSEDCLYLNIFTPTLTNERRRRYKLPVLVFVHGGKYASGSSNSQKYSPENLMDQNVVLVTLNYRLGVMGFFSTVSKVAPGNYGIKDIVMALRWVQENIEVFNGDPNSVTLWGHSAGAAAVHILSFNKNTEGLFHRTSFEAAAALDCLSEGLENSTVELRDKECPGPEDRLCEWRGQTEDSNMTKLEEEMLSCMRSLDAKTIGSVLKQFYIWRGNPCCPFGPVIEEESEEAVLTADPFTTIKRRQFRDLPCITGGVKDEGLVKMMDILDAIDVMKDNFEDYIPLLTEYHTDNRTRPSDRDDFVSAIKEFYFASNVSELTLEKVTLLITDAIMIWPAYQVTRHQFPVMKSSSFFYFFQYEGTFSNTFSYTPTYYGVSHGDDLEYLLPGMYKKYKMLKRTERDLIMSNIMTEMWASFAATGVPKASNTIPWPDYKHANEYLILGNGKEPEITVHKDFLPARMAFWIEVLNDTDEIEDEEEQKEFKTRTMTCLENKSDSGSSNVLFFLLILLSAHFF